MQEELAEIYTDGSCHTQYRLGTWAAIILVEQEKKVISGIVADTTHNRMELLAVIEAVKYVKDHYVQTGIINLCTDSQYVTGLLQRREKLESTDFITSKGTVLSNADLVKIFFETLSYPAIVFTKIKAHQKKTDLINYNREADMLSRKLLRNAVAKISF